MDSRLREDDTVGGILQFLQLIIFIGLPLLLGACSSGPEIPEFCTTGQTIAPKNACSRPYKIKGVWYYPQPHFEYEECGLASFYGGGDVFHGRKTATGEVFDKNEVSAAHKTLPLPCVVVVTNLENGREIQAKVNDRGPFVEGRIIDVSRRTAQLLGFEGKGLAKVRVRTLVPESLALRGIDPSTVLVEQRKQQRPTQNENNVILAAKLPDDLFEQALNEKIMDDEIATMIDLPEQVPQRPVKPLGNGIFVLVRACKNQHEAHGVLRTLVGKINAPVEAVQDKGPKPYMIRVGPFLNMAEANQTLDQLTNAGHVMSRIIIQR